MRIGSVTLPCGAQLNYEQYDSPWDLYGSAAWLTPVGGRVRYRLDRLPVTTAEANALYERISGAGRYWGSAEISYRYNDNSVIISGLELTRDEAQAIADGGDPLTVLGVYPARVVLSIVRLPADG